MSYIDFVTECLNFIKSDTETRGEEMISSQFFAGVFQVTIKNTLGKRKKVMYIQYSTWGGSDYRKIELPVREDTYIK
jgi:hypothetical protein